MDTVDSVVGNAGVAIVITQGNPLSAQPFFSAKA
jgi:hypothetical protein